MPEHEHIQGISMYLLSTSCGESGACENLIPYDIYIEMFPFIVIVIHHDIIFLFCTCRIKNITEDDESWSPIN